MNCFPCFTSQKSKKSNVKRELDGHGYGPAPQEQVITRTPDMRRPKADDPNQVDTSNIQAQNFTFRELATATKNFRQECFMGEGGFGRVYKGTIPATGQVVAVKQLDRNGMQGSKEFLVEVLMLSLLSHENLVKLTGYCADGDQRLLVYEFMPGGPLERRLLERRPDQAPLDWYRRMKIASNAAKGLWYLHDKANPPVIFRDLKSSNILLDNDLDAKLSDYGLAKLAGKHKMNIVPTRVMGTYGYSAPEYIRTGNLTLKSDVYSFGVVLLELITGRRAIDTTRSNEEQNLVSWATPIFRDPKRYPEMADPLLRNQFPEKDLNQVVAIAAMCLQEEAAARPLMSDVVTALSFLSTTPPAVIPAPLPPATSHKSVAASESVLNDSSESESESEIDEEDGNRSDEEGSHHHHHGNETAHHHDHQGNETAQKQKVAAASAKYEDSDASDAEYDYYVNENQQKYSPQDVIETKEFYSESSRKSSTRSSRNDSDSEEGRVSSSHKQTSRKNLSQKSSKKSSVRERDLSQKSSKKSSVRERDLSQKSSKKDSLKDRDLSQKKSSKKTSLKDRGELSQKSSKKSSVKSLSRKRSTGLGSEEGSITSSRGGKGTVSLISRNSSSGEESQAMLGHRSTPQGNAPFGLFSIESVDSERDSNTRSQGVSTIHFDHNSSRGSDAHFGRAISTTSSEEGSFRRLDRATSSKGSYKASVHS